MIFFPLCFSFFLPGSSGFGRNLQVNDTELLSSPLLGGNDASLSQNKAVVALGRRPPLAGGYPALMDTQERRVPSFSLPQAFLPQRCGVPARSRPCHVSDPTPAKRPVGGETRPGCLHLDLIDLMMSGTSCHSARPGLGVGLKPRLAFFWGEFQGPDGDRGGLFQRQALLQVTVCGSGWPWGGPYPHPGGNLTPPDRPTQHYRPPLNRRTRWDAAGAPRPCRGSLTPLPAGPERCLGAAAGAAPWSGTARGQRRHAAPPGGAITARPRPRGRGGVSPLASPQRRGPQGFPPRRGGPAPARPPCER